MDELVRIRAAIIDRQMERLRAAIAARRAHKEAADALLREQRQKTHKETEKQ